MQTKMLTAGIALALVVGIFCGGWHLGSKHVQLQWNAERNEQLKTDLANDAKSSLVTTQIVTQYMDRVQIIFAQGAVINKEVVKYVTQADDAKCTVNNGFVWLHNAAATGQELHPATGASDASGVALSDVARVVADNYGVCRATAEQLGQLQAWVRAQAAIYGPEAKP